MTQQQMVAPHNDLDSSGKLNCAPSRSLNSKLGGAVGSATVHDDAGARGNRGPKHAQTIRVKTLETRAADAETSALIVLRIDIAGKIFERAAPICRFTSQSQKLVAE